MPEDQEIVEYKGIKYKYFSNGNFFIVGTENVSNIERDQIQYPNAVQLGSNIEELVIPTSINGIPILEIAGRAFRKCLSLKTVIINARIKRINMYAFYECISLTNINIPSSCEVIGYGAISCINNEETATGSLAVKFEPNSTIKHIDTFGIERKDVIIIFFCGYEPPYVPEKALFYGSTYNVVFAPQAMTWGGAKAIVDESVCLLIEETKENKKIPTCDSINSMRNLNSWIFVGIFLITSSKYD